jgi:hypothetical protein
MEPLADKWRAFGWHVIEANGHDIPALQAAFAEASTVKGKPHRDHRRTPSRARASPSWRTIPNIMASRRRQRKSRQR